MVEWIKIGDLTPEPMRPVLTHWRTQDGQHGIIEAILTQTGWRVTIPGSMLRPLPGVTHWTPLPELPA